MHTQTNRPTVALVLGLLGATLAWGAEPPPPAQPQADAKPPETIPV